MAFEIEVTNEILELAGSPHVDPCDTGNCLIHWTITQQLGIKQKQVSVGFSEIVIDGKAYECSEELRQWQVNVCNKYLVDVEGVDTKDVAPYADPKPITIHFHEWDEDEKDTDEERVGCVSILDDHAVRIYLKE